MERQAGPIAAPLAVSVEAGVATITINRPARKNAVTQAMWDEIASQVADLEARDDVRILVIQGAGADFSAGADIGEFSTVRGEPDAARRYEATNSAAFRALRTARFPTLAAIRGICFGGGFGLAAACDLRIASNDAIFCVPAARLGLAYPVDAMSDIVEALGPQMARYLAFSAARLTAAEAFRAGFLLDVVPGDALDARVAAITTTIAANAPISVAASKASIRAALSGSTADSARASSLGDATFASRDYAEGRAAFAERRAPCFVGK